MRTGSSICFDVSEEGSTIVSLQRIPVHPSSDGGKTSTCKKKRKKDYTATAAYLSLGSTSTRLICTPVWSISADRRHQNLRKSTGVGVHTRIGVSPQIAEA